MLADIYSTMKVITYIQETQDYVTSCFMVMDKLMIVFGSACMSDYY